MSGQSGTLPVPSETGLDGAANKRGAIGGKLSRAAVNRKQEDLDKMIHLSLDHRSPERRSNTLDSRQPALFYYISGVVIEVEGLKGKLGKLTKLSSKIQYVILLIFQIILRCMSKFA